VKNINANYVAHWKFLVDEAEQFFNERAHTLEPVCTSQLIEVFISGSISEQLTKKSHF